MTLVSATSAIFSEINIPFEGSIPMLRNEESFGRFQFTALESQVSPEKYPEVYQSVRPETQLKLKVFNALQKQMIAIF